jgi:hypothetical protein
LIAWQIIATPLVSSINSLGSGRDFVLYVSLAHFSPIKLDGGKGTEVSLAGGTGALVIVLWLVVFLGLGAWRTRTMDA